MRKWTEIFIPNENRFYDYLLSQSSVTLEGLDILIQFLSELERGDEASILIKRMSELEKKGDAIRRNLISDLLSTFVTPLDREDLYDLSRCIDNVLDYADSTIKTMMIYRVEATRAMIEMVHALREAMSSLQSSIENIHGQPKLAIKHMVDSKKMENRIERMYRVANADLFHETDMHYIFKIREVYRHLSNAADRVDEAADVIGLIVIKGNV